MNEEDVILSHEETIEDEVSRFVSATQRILQAARRRASRELVKRWSENVADRIRAIDDLPRILDEEITKEGYHAEVDLLVEGISKQIEDFANIYDKERERIPELPEFELAKVDEEQLSLFAEGILSALDSISDAFVGEVRAIAPTLYSAQEPGEVLDVVEEKMPKSSELESVAMLFAMSFFRFTSDLVYDRAENKVGKRFSYRYAGPIDSKNRPFCWEILRGGESYLRSEIDQMDNGQIPNVFVNAGGYNCRHWWELEGLDAG